MIRILDTAIFSTLLGMVLLAPIPFGGIYPWTWTLMGVIVGVLLLAWCLRYGLTGTAPPVSLRRIWIIALVFVLTLLWIMLQAVEWTPEHWHHPLWDITSKALEEIIPGRVSVAPSGAGDGLVRLLTYAGIFWLALQYGRDRRNAYRAIQFLVAAGAIHAVYGLTIKFTGAGTILWYEKERYADLVTSTFRYKNAYAAYAGFCALCAFALLLKGLKDIAEANHGKSELRRRVFVNLAEEGWLYLATIALGITALLLSESRAGFLSVMAGFITMFFCAWATRGARLPYLRSSLLCFGAIALLLLAVSGGATFNRMAEIDAGDDFRIQLYGLVLTAIGDTPLLGVGSQNFFEIYQLYHPSIGSLTVRAHNSYLENALELGIPASILLELCFAGLAVICTLGVVRRRRDAMLPCLGVAINVQIGIHAGLDFIMQEPGIAATFALLSGITCAQSWNTRES